MQRHIKNYFGYYQLDENSHLTCEACWLPAKDIHHIDFRSSFWKKTKHLQDAIENLIALCRKCHNKAHFKEEPYIQKDELREIHNKNLY